MNNNQPLLVDDAALAYLATQIRAYADNAVAEAQQTSVSRSGSKWKDLVDEINYLCGTSYGYNEDVDTLTTALQVKFPDISTGLPVGYIPLAGVVLNQGLPSDELDSAPKLFDNMNTIIELDDSEGNILDIKLYSFCGRDNLTYANFPNATHVGSAAFADCHGLEEVRLSSCTALDTAVFSNDTSLKTVYLPNVKTAVGTSFSQCSSLENLDLPNLETIGGFQGMAGLKSLSVPKLGVPSASAWASFVFQTNNIQHLTIKALTFVKTTMNGATNNDWKNLYLVKPVGDPLSTDSDFRLWTGSNSWSTTRNDFVPQQSWDTDMNGDPIDCSGFSTNAQKALYCFKNFFMPAFADVTGLGGKTATFKSTIYDVITTDTDITGYFSSHGWTLARI